MKKAKEENKTKAKTKKYLVAEVFSCGFRPHVEFVTDSREEAEQFAALVQRNNPDNEYIVFAQI
jgi:hypothetical protein